MVRREWKPDKVILTYDAAATRINVVRSAYRLPSGRPRYYVDAWSGWKLTHSHELDSEQMARDYAARLLGEVTLGLPLPQDDLEGSRRYEASYGDGFAWPPLDKK